MERKGGSQYKLASPCMFRLPLPPSDEVSQRTALCSFLAALFFFKNCKLLLFSLFCFLIFALVLSRLCVFLLVAPFAVLAPSPKVCNNSAIETCKERRGCVPSCSNGVLHSKRSTEYGNNHAAKRIRHWSPSKEDSIVDVAFRPPPPLFDEPETCARWSIAFQRACYSPLYRETRSARRRREKETTECEESESIAWCREANGEWRKMNETETERRRQRWNRRRKWDEALPRPFASWVNIRHGTARRNGHEGHLHVRLALFAFFLFPSPHCSSLLLFSTLFNRVEMNSTFAQGQMKGWNDWTCHSIDCTTSTSSKFKKNPIQIKFVSEPSSLLNWSPCVRA